jgi:site-specific DNA recombinase
MRCLSSTFAFHFFVGGMAARTGGARYSPVLQLPLCSPTRDTSRAQEAVDALVRDIVIARLLMQDAREPLEPVVEIVDDHAEELATIRTRRDEAAAMFAREQIDAGQLARITGDLEAWERALRPPRPRSTPKPAALTMAGDGAAEAWTAATLEVRRAVVAELLEIRVLPTRKGSRSLDPESVAIKWRT